MDPDTIWSAIFGQESNSGRNNRTSVTGAIGPGQIQPSTFAVYAQPGENINNYNDNIAVSKRIVNDYYTRYGADPGRIATAYFSGPGNVAPPNSPIPYVADKPDPTGKRTSAYVSDISKRLKQMPADQNFDPNAAFSQWEKPAQASAPDQFNPDTSFSQWEKPSGTTPVAPTSIQAGSIIPVPTEAMTPQQRAEQAQGLKNGQAPSSWISQNYHPLDAIQQTVGAGVAQLGQGVQDIRTGNVATGVGNLFGGAVGTTLGPIIGPYNETFRAIGQAIGQPQAANIASLVAPTKGIGTTVKSALPAERATNGLINLIGKDNITNVIAKLETNPNLSLMDVSQPVKTVAAGLANSPETPAAQNIMRLAYENRTGARQDIVQQAIDRTLGPKIDVKQYLDQLTENVKKVGAERINPAIAGAQPIGVMPLVDRIDSVIKAPGTADATINRLTKLKDQITAEAGKDGFIDPEKLHGIQWRVRAEAENLSKSASGADRNLAGPLFTARNDMVNAIDNASGGKYKPALAGFRDESHVQEAFDKGFKIFKTGGIEDFPEYWNAWIKDAQPAEIAAAKVGALTAARKTIEGMQSGARRGEGILNTTFDKERISALFGPQQTKELSGLLEDAKSMAETNSLLYQNSKTGLVQAGQKYFEPRQVGQAGAAGGIGMGAAGLMATAAGLPEAGLVGTVLGGLKLGHSAIQKLGQMSDKSTATKFARLASAGSGPDKNELLQILRSVQSSGQGNKIGNLTSSLARLAAP